ncbi:hypothetical protein M422DRAFT_241396 [Sphaerobolus stellatus SS14]|nr:hypothetical protein M422DRAFT_241396 [Sphaerobolus stellatus SS14]
MANYQVGDKVEYHPVGGGSNKTSTSVGQIVDIQGDRFHIKNDNTGKVTGYLEMNIVGKAQ